MNILLNIILLLHVVAAIGVIVLVLLQHGKGADMGAAFGGGSAGSLFGATGSANFLSRLTAVLATVFFLTSLSMAYLATHKPKAGGGVMDAVTNAPKPPAAPAVPGVPSPAAIPGQTGAPAGASPAQSAPVPSLPPSAGDAPKSTQIPK
ncbi:MAG: preprotein translocase subunit SecG [Burkholderiales bacterium]|nr:preprotein translocase subunit SecG [Burkholderiales bacterium]